MFTVTKVKITGFKSFAYSTELLIENGVTGIIGPNGCGKSNIFEAIRWVMGESSSKSLRSGSMDEVIFNGTTNLPAKNFAEVSIELDNFSGQISNIISNENRVSISRTLERGVGSFYKINNKDVRAKDINVLFSDSGSGPRSSSIISQGNIDQIINFKPIERKIILEDAAGISGLQSRRHESELKLQSTELNLEKIDINLENLNDQKRSLSRQSRQAERYEKLSQSIKFYQSLLLLTEWKTQIKGIDESGQKISLYSENLKKLIFDSNQEKTKIREIQNSNSRLTESKDLLNNNLYKITSEQNDLQNKLDSFKSKKDEINRFLLTIRNDSNVEAKRLVEIDKYILDLERKLSESNELNDLKETLIKYDAEENKLKNEIKNLETEFVNEIQLTLGEEFRSDNLKEAKENLIKKEQEILREISDNSKNKINFDQLINKEEKNSEIIEKNNKNLDKEILLSKKRISEVNNKKNQLKNSISSLNEKIEEMSNKYTSCLTEIKTLTEISGQMNLSKDSIINLLKIERGYEDLVYAALMNELDATINKSAKTWIKKTIKDINPINNSITKYVKAPKELELILSQIGFVENSSRALDIQKNLKVGQSLVDKKGNVWRWDGFISEGNLQQKKIIDSLKRIETLKEDEKKILHELNLYKKEKNEKILIERKNFDFEKTENLKTEGLYKKLDSGLIELSKIREKISLLKNNKDKLVEVINSLVGEKNRIQKEIKIIKTEEENKKGSEEKNEREQVQKNIENLDKKIEEKRKQIVSIKEIIMKKEINRTFNQNDLKKSLKRRDECQNQIDTLKKREVSYLDEDKKLEYYPKEFEKKINDLQGKKNEVSIKLKKNQDEITQCINDIKLCEDRFNKYERLRENQKNEIIRIESYLENLKLKEKELRNMIFEKTSTQPEDLEKNGAMQKEKNADVTAVNDILEKLIFQREQMGPVNLRAKIEENELSKTIDDLELEKNDLVQAIQKLRVAINKINLEGRNRLFQAYEKVDKNFSDLFKKLFDGGEAKLELIKSDDPLQTGLEILARPPGKKLSSISLLSGGEKTLTAIALIFSIFLINPSPLCILDEVDAALDDVNVEKFCKILKELKNNTKTKFLIITHHKITMSSIDRVYGVTMAQKGISDLVSVDFDKIDFKEAV